MVECGFKLYKDSRHMFRYEEMLKILKGKHRLERIRFRLSFQKLISGLAEESEIEDLFQDPTGETWNALFANGLEDKLKKKVKEKAWKRFCHVHRDHGADRNRFVEIEYRGRKSALIFSLI